MKNSITPSNSNHFDFFANQCLTANDMNCLKGGDGVPEAPGTDITAPDKPIYIKED